MLPEIDPQLAELLTRWTVRLAVACYLGRVLLDVGLRGKAALRADHEFARWLWTIGCLLYMAHVGCAFAFFHDWSHARAYAHTAAQTEAITGLRWGGGLYFNYAFTLLWLADSAAWWLRGVNSHYRAGIYFWSVHAVFAFMVFNATIVFGPPVWKWIAPLVVAAFAIAYLLPKLGRRPLR